MLKNALSVENDFAVDVKKVVGAQTVRRGIEQWPKSGRCKRYVNEMIFRVR
jgi:hypothetical protein